MAKFFDALTDELIAFVKEQQIFFVASACTTGRVNLSPKGMDTLRILNPGEVAYLDLTGSGNETASHLIHDGRLTLMMCSFGIKPLILRLYGRGSVARPGTSRWEELIGLFPSMAGARQVVTLRIESLQTSCGFAVPRYEFVETRTKLSDWAAAKTDEEIKDYWRRKNLRSIDGFTTSIEESDRAT
jgi:hypothetical protein